MLLTSTRPHIQKLIDRERRTAKTAKYAKLTVKIIIALAVSTAVYFSLLVATV